MTIKLKAKTKDKLEELGDELVELETSIRAIIEENEEVFAKVAEYNQEKDALIDKMKTEARKRATTGDTTVLIERPDLFVSVRANAPPRIYDVEKVEKLWPDSDSYVVKSVDSKAVEKAVGTGALSMDLVSKCSRLGDPPTPAVTVKLP